MRNSGYKTEIFLEYYNKPFYFESPFTDFQDKADKQLNTFDYYNLDLGFGFNPINNLSYYDLIEILPGDPVPFGNTADLFLLKNQNYTNFSLSIKAIDYITKINNLNLNVKSRQDEIERRINQTNQDNYSLIYQGNTTINNMDGYEFVISNLINGFNYIYKKIYIQSDDRIFAIEIKGFDNLYHKFIDDIEKSLNSTLTIISPYYYIDYY